MTSNIPDGNFHDGHLIWDVTPTQWVVSAGWEFRFPDLSTSSLDQWRFLETSLKQIMGRLNQDEWLQVISFTGSDYEREISAFESVTEGCGVDICKSVRSELSSYFRRRMEAQTLIHSNVHIYISKRVNTTRSAFKEVFQVVKRTFEERGQYFDIVLRSLGGSAKPLDNEGLYMDMLRHWSPGQILSKVHKPDWEQSIESLCRFSDISPRSVVEHGFSLDNHYVGLWVAKLMPGSTTPKTMDVFSNLTIPGLRISVNIQPLSIEGEIKHENKRAGILTKNLHHAEVRVSVQDHEKRITRLRENQVKPFKAQIVISLHCRKRDDLDDKMEAIRAAMDHAGFQAYRPNLSVTAVSFFNCGTPGYGPSMDYDLWHKIDDKNLAHLCPVGATSTGDLENADWLACGFRNNVIGGKLFIGSQPADTLVVGTKGSGKSALTQVILLQSAHQFGFIAVVDNGLSWLETCRLLDPTCDPIIVRSRSGHTFNPLDPRGLALSPEHKRSAVALIELIARQSKDEDRQADRSDLISNTIQDIYESEYRHWKNKNPELHFKACRRALMAARTINRDFVDAVQWLKEVEQDQPEKMAQMEAAITDDDAVAFSRDKNLGHFVMDYAFSTWTPEMFPTLSDLYEELYAQRNIRGASPHCESLAGRLRRWLSNGEFGPLVDGITNIDLGSVYIKKDSPIKVIYFELGTMKESEEELRAVIGYLITTELRNVIQSMPRGIKKALIVEELTAFMRVPNAGKIVTDFSERLRKYMCWFCCIFQQYYTLLKSDPTVAEALIGNAQAMLLLRNINRAELDALSSHLVLPDPVKDALQSFPMPELLKGRADQYAGFVYVQRSDTGPRFTIGKNVISKKVEEITSSSGDVFEQKRQRLSQAA
jgi:TraG P-loop domain